MSSESIKQMWKEIYDEIFEEGFRAYCEANRLLERDLSQGLVNERIPAKEEQEARESYYEYMKRRSREEDNKFKEEEEKRMRLPPRLSKVVSSDTADAICKDALVWHRTEVLDDLIAAEDNNNTWGARYVHPEDVHWKRDLLKAMNVVLEYWGVESKGTIERRKEKL